MNNILPSSNTPSQTNPSLSTNADADADRDTVPVVTTSTDIDNPSSSGGEQGGQAGFQPTQAAETSTLTADLALSLDATESPASPPASAPQDTTHAVADPASYYWDATTMAPLNAASAAAIARLRAYRPPPFPTWDLLPASRRAAVLILLFADRWGDLRVVITMRAASLRSFSGHAAFPGGKADSAAETPYQIARREAWEEIGLPMDDTRLPKPFRIEPLTCLPCSLAKTELVVRPCVAYLHPDRPGSTSSNNDSSDKSRQSNGNQNLTADESMIPRLDAKEVAAVFSAPLHNFLQAKDEPRRPGEPPLPPGDWYDGYWHYWHDTPWRVHNFRVPVNNQRVSKPKLEAIAATADTDTPPPPATIAVAKDQKQKEERAAEQKHDKEDKDDDTPQRFLVWGLTGRMLVDAARVAYGEEPEFEHNDSYGDEELIAPLYQAGRLPHIEKKNRTTTTGGDDSKAAAAADDTATASSASGEKRKRDVSSPAVAEVDANNRAAAAAAGTRAVKDTKI